MMKKLQFKQIEFIKTALQPKQYPLVRDMSGNILCEIATAGRSNVGKSSLLNHLFQHKTMVKTSSTPGKTQALNFFKVDDAIVFTDLPGYGFANVPQNVRKEWGPMVQKYLEERKTLKVILFLMDIRRIPNEDDLRFVEWVVHHNKAMILVITKCDKVTLNERNANTKKILQALNYENLHHIHYSVTKNQGRKELIGMINEALADEMELNQDGYDQ